MSIIQRIGHTKLFRNAGIYTVGHIMNAAIPFLLMPVLTRYLSPEDYGITAMLAVLMGIYTPFVGLNMHGFVSVAYFKQNLNFSLVISTVFGLLMISLLFATVVTVIGRDIISNFAQFPSDWLWVVILLCFTNFFIIFIYLF